MEKSIKNKIVMMFSLAVMIMFIAIKGNASSTTDDSIQIEVSDSTTKDISIDDTSDDSSDSDESEVSTDDEGFTAEE